MKREHGARDQERRKAMHPAIQPPRQPARDPGTRGRQENKQRRRGSGKEKQETDRGHPASEPARGRRKIENR